MIVMLAWDHGEYALNKGSVSPGCRLYAVEERRIIRSTAGGGILGGSSASTG